MAMVSRRWPSGVLFVMLTVVGVLLGALSAGHFGLPMVGALTALGLIALIAKSPGWGVGLWLLAITNSLPILDIGAFAIPGRFRVGDLLMVALVLAFAVAWLRRGSPLPAGWLRRPIVVVAIMGIAWWIVVLFALSWAAAGVPLKLGALYGRDLVYTPLVMVCCLGLLRDWRDVSRVLVMATTGACLFTVGQVAKVALGRDIPWIIHPYRITTTAGLARLYQDSQLLVMVGFALVFWLAVVSHRGPRRLYAVAAVLLSIGVAVSLGRATYVAVAVGMLVSLLCALMSRSHGSAARRAIVVAGLVVIVGGLAAVAFSPSSEGAPEKTTTTSAVYSRVGSLIRQIESPGSGSDANWSYRLDLAERMQAMLGLRGWAIGLGFLNPQAHYVVGLPEGSIRNSDVGALTVLMPMGLVGLALALTPAVLIVVASFRSSRLASLAPTQGAVLLAFVAFFSGSLVSSITLTTLVNSPVAGVGAAMAAIVLSMSFIGRRSRGFLPAAASAQSVGKSRSLP